MGLQTKKDFAEMCGLPPKNLATYIGRGKVIVGEQDLIDDKNPINKAFLVRLKSKATEKDALKHIKKYPAADQVNTQHTEAFNKIMSEDEESEPEASKIDLAKSLEKLAFFRAEKTERETIKLDLDIAKRRGEIIPSDMVKPIFLQHNQFVVTQFKNAAEDLVRLIGKRRELTNEDISEIKGELVDVINRAITDATSMSIGAVEDIINEFKVKRGVGERS